MTKISLIDDPDLKEYRIGESGFVALVTGRTGSGKTLALRNLIKNLGKRKVVVIATDPRMAPLDGLDVKMLECWVPPAAEGAELKAAAEAAWDRIQKFHRNLAAACANPDVEVPEVVVHDNLSNTGDMLAAKFATPGQQLSQPQWGFLARSALNLATFYRGLQGRRMIRIINCTTGTETNEYGQKVPALFIGTGGQQAPKHFSRYVDYQFHVEATYDPTNAGADPDGMVRTFQTCEMNGVVAKGSPNLPRPYMKADWWEVYKLTFGVKEGV